MNVGAELQHATLAVQPEGNSLRARLCFSGREFFFQGHFPERPVLPAVVQVAAAVHFAGLLLGGPQRLAEVTRAKFQSPTGPGVELALQLVVDAPEPGRTRVRASLHDGDTEVSELVLRVVPEPE
ncbi:MAG: hypothetical protein IT463_02820 [Planctomycetes bacterium]|nr:hypothetical protein [Planctomycetota bacterium]